MKNRDAFTHEALAAYLDYISGPIGQASYFQHQMRHYSAHHTMEIADRLGELAGQPTQVIWSAEDTWLKKGWAEQLAGAIPGSELHLVKDAAHFAMEDQPAEIAHRIADFLARVGR